MKKKIKRRKKLNYKKKILKNNKRTMLKAI